MAEPVVFLNNADLFGKALCLLSKMIHAFNCDGCASPVPCGVSRKGKMNDESSEGRCDKIREVGPCHGALFLVRAR